MKHIFLAVLLTWATSLFAAQIRVGTLNCYLLFNPSISHQGQVAAQHPLTATQYQEKLTNLVTLVSDAEFVGLQEVGGRQEVEDLAKTSGWEWAFSKGKDSYTGEEVAAIFHLPGWKVTNNGRVGDLDTTLSKHLLVTATKEGATVRFLVVHLIRPIGQNAVKHQKQLSAIHTWASKIMQQEPASSLVILGDTNDTQKPDGASIFGIGKEVGQLLGYAPTHLDGKSYDRLVLVGSGSWDSPGVSRPPYGKRPNDSLRQVWTDHFALKATLIR